MAEQKLRKYAKGVYFNLPSPKAPEWAKGQIVINIDVFLKMIEEYGINDMVRIDINIPRGAEKPSTYISDYVPNQKYSGPAEPRGTAPQVPPQSEFDDLPF